MEIFTTNDKFDFSKLTMTKPISVSGGNYFIRCLVNTQPLYIQPPKCKTRQGIVKASVGKRLYSDLMFTNENEDFIRWMENLENYSQQYIYNNREKWFDGEMELHDIENYFTSPLKLFKSGKYYLVRTNINTVLGKPSLKIYDENESEVDFDSINDTTHIMTILEIQGIKCSSKSFQIEIELKQMMVLQPANIFEKCIIKTTKIDTQKSMIDTRPLIASEEYVTPDVNENKIVEQELSNEDELHRPEISEPSLDTKSLENEEENIPEQENTNEDILIKMDTSTTDEGRGIDETSLELFNVMDTTPNGLEEVEFHLEELTDTETVSIKKRDNIYYEMYKEAKKKAKVARDLALSAYLEAKRIKNTYMLEDIDDEDDEDDEDEDDEDDDDDDDEDDDEDEDEDED